MRILRSLVCAAAMVLASTVLAVGDQREGDPGVDQLLQDKLTESFRTYVNKLLLESEQLSKYVDLEYWNTVKDDFGARVGNIISEDEFIQAILPILTSVKEELQEVLTLTVQALLVKGEQIATKVRAALEQVLQKSAEIIDAAIAKIEEVAKKKPGEYKALLSKLGEGVGQKAVDYAQETTLLVGAVILAAGGFDFDFYNP